MTEISLAANTDIPRVLELRRAAFSAHAPSAYSAQEVENLLDDIDETELSEMVEEKQLFVAREGGELIGVAGWKDGRIRHVYVAPGHEKKGIGTAMLCHAEDDFRARTRAAEIRAGVGLQAEGFYVANGYEILMRDKSWDGSEFLWMVKRFSA